MVRATLFLNVKFVAAISIPFSPLLALHIANLPGQGLFQDKGIRR